jgi:PAS domain S-box-containing protein
MARAETKMTAFSAGAEAPSAPFADPSGALFENDFQPMLLVDPATGAIADANPAACAFYGYSRGAFARMNAADINTAPESEVRAALADALAGKRTQFQFRHRLANGEIREVEDWMGPVAAGGRRLLCSMIRDITNRRETEAELRASQAMLATAERIARVGSWDWDIANSALVWSEEQCRLFGITSETFSEKYEGWMSRVHPDHQKRVQAAIDAGVSGERDYDVLYPIVFPDGTERIIHARGEVFRDESGKAIRMVGTCHDVTELQKAAAELEFANTLLAAQIENSPDGILVVDANRRVVLNNRRFGELWKIPQEVIATGRADAVLKAGTQQMKDPEAFFERVTYLYDHPDLSGNEDIEFKDGRVFDRHTTTLRDSTGKYLGRVWIFHDITGRRQAEEAIRQSQKLESVGQLTGGIAHDFNNLLGVVIGNLDLVLDGARLDERTEKLLQAALGAALRGGDLTQRLLAFSRKQSLQPKVLNLGERLMQFGTLLRRALGEQFAVEVRAAADLWPVVADASQIDNVVLNLAINARDAMPKGGTIAIEVSNARLGQDYAARHADAIPGEYVLFSIRDTGTGMPPEVLERAFEPFFTTKEVSKGSGLGLSMVYGFVKQSSGHITIDSEVGRGTTVKIYLPRAGEAAAAEAETETGELSLKTENELILVVEDNESVRNVVMTQLDSMGYRTLEADSGDAALALIDQHPDIHIMFSDVVMRGGMNGYELAAEARRRRPGLKILLTSGFEMNAAAAGPDGGEKFELLKKPYRKLDLAHKLRQILAA